MATAHSRWDQVSAMANLTEERFPDRSGLVPDANQRRLASIDLNRAVRDGRVIKPTKCEECGAEPGHTRDDCLHGHHRDYQKPLEVQWLCRPCHMAKHRIFYGKHG